MTSYINKTGGPPNCDYEYHVLHLTSRLGDDGGTEMQYRQHLTKPLKDIVAVEVLTCSFHPGGSADDVCYLVIDELSSQFNQQASNLIGNTFTTTPLGNPLLTLPVVTGPGNRVVYQCGDCPNITEFIHPIERLSRLHVAFRQCDGTLVPSHASPEPSYLSLRFWCLRQNLCKDLKVEDLKGEDYRGAKPVTKKPVRPVIYYYED